MLALAHAHMRKPLPSLEPNASVPEGFEAWLQGLLAKAPADRPRCATDAARQLNELEHVAVSGVFSLGSSGPTMAFETPEAPPTLPSGSFPALTGASPVHAGDVRGAVDWQLPETWGQVVESSVVLPGTGIGILGLRDPPFAGREAERQRLWELLRSVGQSGQRQAIVLRGERGLGKSRLADWLAVRAAEAGVYRVIRGNLTHWDSDKPALLHLFRTWFAAEGLDTESLAERIRRDSVDVGHAPALLLAAWLQKESAADDVDYRYHLAQVLACPSGRPALVVLDEAHRCPDVLRLVSLALRLEGPVVFLVVWDDEPGQRAHRALSTLQAQAGVVDWEVAAPSDEELASVLGRSLHLGPKVADVVAARARGNYLIAVEMSLELARTGQLEYGESGYTAPIATLEALLPQSVRDLWEQRLGLALDGLPDAAYKAVELAAALGFTVDNAEWAAVCAAQHIQLEPQWLHVLFAQRLAVPTTAGWRFAHDMLRHTVETGARERRTWARASLGCANMLAAAGNEDDPRYGRFLHDGGALGPAISAFGESARRSLNADSYGAALSTLAAREAALEELGVPATDWRVGETHLLRARAYGELELSALGLAEARKALVSAERAGPVQVARVHQRIGELLRLMGEYDVAAAHIERALVAAELGRDALTLGRVLTSLVTVRIRRGRLEESVALARRALVYLRLGGQRIWESRGLNMLGWALQVSGESAEAALILEEGLQSARGRAPKMESVILSGLGDLARETGNLAQAGELYREAIAIRQRLGLDAMFVRLNAVLNDCAARDFDAAASKLVDLFASLERNERPPVRAVAHTVAALIAVHGEDWSAATEELERAATGLEATGLKDPDIRNTMLEAHRVAASAGQVSIALRAGELAVAQTGQGTGGPEQAVREEFEAYRTRVS